MESRRPRHRPSQDQASSLGGFFGFYEGPGGPFAGADSPLRAEWSPLLKLGDPSAFKTPAPAVR